MVMAMRTACRLCPLRNGFSTSKYGSVSKWSWQYAQRADYAHSAMAFRHQNTEVYRSGHGNAHGVPIMPTPQWLINIKNTEVYRSGHNGPHSKCGNGVTRSWVRIPPLPPRGNNPNQNKLSGSGYFFVFYRQ